MAKTKLMIKLCGIITNNSNVEKHRENVGKIQDIKVSKVATYPNHLPLRTILNKTRFKEKVH